jgi:serine protease
MKLNLKILVMSFLFMVASLIFVPAAVHASNLEAKMKGVTSTEKFSKTSLHIKFEETAQIVLINDQFVSLTGQDTTNINSQINSAKTSKKTRLFSERYETINQKRAQLSSKTSSSIPDLNSYFRITLKDSQDINQFINEARNLPQISEIYAEPLPVATPRTAQQVSSPDYTGLQQHFAAAPTGMGINEASSYPGALGDNVKIADLEYSWNTAHEDLNDARQSDTRIANGTAVDPFNDNNHGTAVAGLISGDKNSFGINGIAPNSKLHLVNTNNAEQGWDIANAVYVASTKLGSGDVMLIEQQTWGPTGHGYVPVEWVPAIYDAIRFATASGIIVVEAAGNGSENLNDPVYGSTFPMNKPDSGAIIVGAGTACNGTSAHSRMYFSNYGDRVNVQGYGECVTTTGYGSLYFGNSINSYYTNGFNGTSSASALVAAAITAVSSSYEHQKNANLTPLSIRQLITQTGTAQNFSTSGNIGPLPNIAAAIASFTTTDITPPSTPTNLSAALNSSNKVVLNWNSSNDTSGPVSYRIYRGSTLIATISTTSFVDTSVRKNTSYIYKVQAIDKAGNVSAYSNSVTIKTNR